MAADQVLSDSLSLDGIRRLHILQMGSPVELSKWMARVPYEAECTLARTTWEEEALGVHHLLLAWRARELVNLKFPDGDLQLAVVWGIDRRARQSVRAAIDDGAGYFELMAGELPDMAIISSSYNQMVSKITDRVRGEPAYSMRWNHPTGGRLANEIAIRTADWVPVGSVIICKEVSDER